MSDIKLSGKLPGGDKNGLAKIAGALVKDPHKVHALLVLVDNQKTVVDNDTGDSIPTVRIRSIEAILKQDYAQAERLLRRAMEQRTGQTVLDMDLEDEIADAFRGVTFEQINEAQIQEEHGDNDE
jgi:hypothetical protein